MMLERCDGPECPMCGCRDAVILRDPAPPAHELDPESLPFILPSSMDPAKAAAWQSATWWDAGRARCKHCGTEYSFRNETAAEPEDEDPPPATETTCPECGGSRYWVYKTRGDVRYRKCRDCRHRGENNKSIIR